MFYGDNEREIAADVVHRMINRAIEMEGTVTGEHGVGLVKRDYLPNEIGQDTVDAMRRVSIAADLRSECWADFTIIDQAGVRSVVLAEL